MANAQSIISHADAFVVVSWWQERGTQPGKGSYSYETHSALNDALDTYREYEDGEYARARAVGIFAAKDGLPIGAQLEPRQILRLMAETRLGKAA